MSEVKSASPRTVRMMVLAAAVLLVVGIAGVVQSTQAQLVFMSENYVAEQGVRRAALGRQHHRHG